MSDAAISSILERDPDDLSNDDIQVESTNQPETVTRSLLGATLNRRQMLRGMFAVGAGAVAANLVGAKPVAGQANEFLPVPEIDINDESTWPPQFTELEAEFQQLSANYKLDTKDPFTASLINRDPEFFTDWGIYQDRFIKVASNEGRYSSQHHQIENDQPGGEKYVKATKRIKNDLSSNLPHLVLINNFIKVEPNGQLVSANDYRKDYFHVTEFDPENMESLLMKYIQGSQLLFDENSDLVKEYLDPNLVANYYKELYSGMNTILDSWTARGVSELGSVRGLENDKPLLDLDVIAETTEQEELMERVQRAEEFFFPELEEYGYYTPEDLYENNTESQRLNKLMHFIFSNVNNPKGGLDQLIEDNKFASALKFTVQNALYHELSGPMVNLKYPWHMPQAGEEHLGEAVSPNDVFTVAHERIERARAMVGMNSAIVDDTEAVDSQILILREVGDTTYKNNKKN